MVRGPRLAFLACVFFAPLACGDDAGQPDGGDASVEAGVDAPTYPAPHTPMPQATSGGGSVIASPKVVAISFQADPLQGAIDAFASDLQNFGDYWKGAVSEYGVGPIASSTYHAAETAAQNLADADVQSWLTDKIQNDATFPKPDESTIYTLFYPSGTNVVSGGGVTCQQFQGYHDSFALGGTDVVYAIVPRCAPPPVQGVTDADQMTAEASHEIVEAATDPLPFKSAAYLTVDSASHAWELLGGGEIGDLCAGFGDVFYKPNGFDSLVQRVWSNAAAAAGHDPCEPNGASPYFNSAPVLADTITLYVSGQAVKTNGVKLLAGQSTTIELDLYSDAPTSGPWKISVLDLTSAFFGGKPALSFTLDQTTGQNGDVRQLTIQSLRNVSGGAPFWIQNDLGTTTTVWVAAVNNF
ncbi:MAG TPA: hypothetical protein VGH28_31310 [Polyangiaceae bacterium]